MQSYASYSLKKIYNVNALDLAKVGKAFGFAVPPRVNIKMGEGATRSASGKKRHRDEMDEMDDGERDKLLGEIQPVRLALAKVFIQRRSVGPAFDIDARFSSVS